MSKNNSKRSKSDGFTRASIYMTVTQKKAIEQIAVATNQTFNAVVRDMIRAQLLSARLWTLTDY